MKLGALIVCGVILAGCAGTPQTRALTSFAIACDSYASTLTVLAGLRERGKLSVSEVAKVDSVRSVVTPACKTKDPINPDALLNSIERGVHDLIRLKEKRHASG